MKIIFNLLLIALFLAAGWHFHPDIIRSMDSSREAAKARRQAELAEAVKKVTGTSPGRPASGPADSGNQTSAGQLAQSLRKSSPTPPAELPGGTAKPGMGTADTPPPPAEIDPIDAKYPMPVFKEITEITKEWSSIPSRAFPRPVKTLVAINLEGPNGKIPLPEQSDALAVGMTQGMLVLMKSREINARSLIPLANTDLKETLSTLYEKYKAYKIKEVTQQRERARRLLNKANGATETEMAAAGPKPSIETGGVITAMVTSLRTKEITETSEDRITSWGGLNIEQVKGETYWTGTIQCTVDNAIFGPTPTELMALIRDDKVVKWLYSGSKEDVQ